MPHFSTEHWRKTDSYVEFIPSEDAPALPVTSVKVYVFRDNKLLLANIDGRGWDLPGGHIDSDETPEQAVRRELKEETGASVKRLSLIGYLKITNEKENEQNKQYPQESCMLIYKGLGVTIDEAHTFSLEASESRFVAMDELPNIHHEWNEAKKAVIDFAITR